MEEITIMDENLCPLNITIIDSMENSDYIEPESTLETEQVNTTEIVKKKRGRKKKEECGETIKPPSCETGHSGAKKRGRKPKGGKITFKQPELNPKNHSVANIILHLKCSLNDLNEYNNKINKIIKNPLEYNPSIPPNVESYIQNDNLQFSSYNDSSLCSHGTNANIDINSNLNDSNHVFSCNSAYNINKSITENTDANTSNYVCSKCSSVSKDVDGADMKEINLKLKKIKINLYKNLCQDKKSACFWCTYDYDNPECCIPKYDIDEKIYGYGSFCRPECAVAYLMKENIDDSTKFERYHLLNQIYSKVYNYKKNIKPAPNPYFLLEKYYGNLTIQEYRKLLKTEHMLLVIDKPMTRILPELHEDNELFVLGNTSGSTHVSTNNTTGVYKVKRQSEKNQLKNKNAIVKDNFGIQ
jgi:hypothetical protein